MGEKVEVTTSELTDSADKISGLAGRMKKIAPEFDSIRKAMPGSVSADLVALVSEGLSTAFDRWGEQGTSHASNLDVAAGAYEATDQSAAADYRGPLLRRSTILDR
ncbi:type VII secretion target [Kineosporia babensis]|uniref:Excreted virulence factor EspC (Type VII ESX diderm) n=1 Tax=Kineosporia babensis TaxID=499548 RepID=A0A9X1T3B0_9ACTN|nr:type VII secretion target [Kineosporia babensis]MCD5315478.1 hypothetical protein [Kineosporia babensis]